MAFETSEGKVIKSITLTELDLEKLIDGWYKEFGSLGGINWDSLGLDIIDSAEKVEVEEEE